MALQVFLQNSKLLEMEMEKEQEKKKTTTTKAQESREGGRSTGHLSMDRFWEDQWLWSPLTDEKWRSASSHGDGVHSHGNWYGHHFCECCRFSPSPASESSASSSSLSLSTQESSSFSSRCDLLQSPDIIPASARACSRFFSAEESLLRGKLPTDRHGDGQDSEFLRVSGRAASASSELLLHVNPKPCESKDYLVDSFCCTTGDDASSTFDHAPLQRGAPSPVHHGDGLAGDGGWSSDSESWATASSQELPAEEMAMEHHQIEAFSEISEPHRNGGSYSNSDEDFSYVNSRLISTMALQSYGEAPSSPKIYPKIRHACSKSGASSASFPSKSELSTPFRQELSSSAFVKGILRFSEQGGSPCYSFSMEASDEVFFVRASRPKKQKLKQKEYSWIYTFHSRRDSGQSKNGFFLPKQETMESNLGKMKVFDADQYLSSGRSLNGGLIETRFVLYRRRETKSLPRNADGLKLQTKDVLGLGLGLGLVSMDARSRRRRRRSDDHDTLLAAKSQWSGHAEDDFSMAPTAHKQRIELAAIVITSYVNDLRPDQAALLDRDRKDTLGWGAKFLARKGGGWGMRFLDKSPKVRGYESAGIINPPHYNPMQIYACDHPENVSNKLPLKPKNESRQTMADVTVILPAGDHGFPTKNATTRSRRINDDDDASGFLTNCSGNGEVVMDGLECGPTPLIQRWLSGGDCDCGGWDMGCGLSVLKLEKLGLPEPRTSVMLTNHDILNWLTPRKPLHIVSQGHNPKSLVALEIMDVGLFSLSFRPHVSPLQALAMAVAILHQQIALN